MAGQNNSFTRKRIFDRIVIFLFCIVISVCTVSVLVFSYTPNQNALGALASVCMDVICMSILLVLVVNLASEKNEMTRTTKLFLGLMLGTMLALFLDFLTWSSDGSLAYGEMTYVYTVSSLCCGSILAVIFVFYLCSYLDDMHGIKKSFKKAQICALCDAFAFVLTITLAITGNAFILVDGHYKTGALYDGVTVIPVLTLFFMTGYSIYHIKRIGLHDVIAVVGYIFIMIAGALVESEYNIGTSYVAISIADIFIFVMLQNKMIDRMQKQKEILAEEVTSQNETLESMAGIIKKEKKNVEKWIIKSNTDELTGFYNRHAYEDEIAILEESKVNDQLVYVSMDVNSLKIVNDTKGHEAGDELLTGACECMRQCFGAYGKLFRTGGDEFVALIYADDSQLKEIKQDIDELTEKWEGHLINNLAVSCGYVTKKEAEGMTIHEMAVLADKRMYENKTKYYQKRGIDRRGQRDAHVALCALYTKILKINITDDSYQIVNVNEDEKTLEMGFADTISGWFEGFAKILVHPDDLPEFMEKTSLEYLSNYFKNDNKSLIMFYRRKIEGEYRNVFMEMIPASNYSDNSQNLFLYVKSLDQN